MITSIKYVFLDSSSHPTQSRIIPAPPGTQIIVPRVGEFIVLLGIMYEISTIVHDQDENCIIVHAVLA